MTSNSRRPSQIEHSLEVEYVTEDPTDGLDDPVLAIAGDMPKTVVSLEVAAPVKSAPVATPTEEDKTQLNVEDQERPVAADLVKKPSPTPESSPFDDSTPELTKESTSQPPVYSAGKGLKGLKARRDAKKKAKNTTPAVKDDTTTSQWSTSVISSKPSETEQKEDEAETQTAPAVDDSPTIKEDLKVEEPSLSRSSSDRSAPGDTGTTPVVSRDSSRMSSRNSSFADRPSSLRSSKRDSAGGISQVLQNKMMFDQQIANQWKRKPGDSATNGSPNAYHRSSSNTSLNSIGSTSSSATASKRGSLRSLSEKPAAGTVAGARSMFEANNKKKSGVGANNKPPPFKPKMAWTAKLESEPPTIPEVQATPAAPVTTSTKKKRFPFKKKKTKTITKEGDTDAEQKKPEASEMIAPTTTTTTLPEKQFEERAIDVPSGHHHEAEGKHTEEVSSTKKPKKAGLISRLTRRSRRSSGDVDSDHESSPATDSSSAPNADSHHLAVNLEATVPEESPITESATFDSDNTAALDADLTGLSTKIASSALVTIDDSELPATDDVEDIPPPSPEQASQEVKSVLESIIVDRKSSIIEAEETPSPTKDDAPSEVQAVPDPTTTTTEVPPPTAALPGEDASQKKKKKRLVLKKRKTNTKKDDVVIPPPETDTTSPPETEKPVSSEKHRVEEDVMEQVIKVESPTIEQSKSIHPEVEIVEENNIEEVKITDPKDHITDNAQDLLPSIKHNTAGDWPEEMMAYVDNNNDDEIAKNSSSNSDQQPAVNAASIIPQISIQEATPVHVAVKDNELATNNEDSEQSPALAPFVDVDLHLNGVGAAKDEDAISITSTDKKKKKRFKFPLRMSSSKKHKHQQAEQQDQQHPPSPTKEQDIWEDQTALDVPGGKLEKKNSSKKLKRPKSLDFLGEIIHPTKHKEDKHTNGKQRPVSVATHELVNNSDVASSPVKTPNKEQKSPSKHRRSFNIFKKKKHSGGSSGDHHDEMDSGYNTFPSPILSSPDVFKIPDVVDNDGRVSVGLTVNQSDHS